MTIENPLGVQNLEDIFQLISDRVIQIVIPIAVLLYVYAGFNLLIAAGRPAYINKARTVFQYTTLGLLVIFIGGGFVDLIRSILNAGQ